MPVRKDASNQWPDNARYREDTPEGSKEQWALFEACEEGQEGKDGNEAPTP